jgi:hypothetical protein
VPDPSRTTLVLVALAAGAVAFAIGVATVAERAAARLPRPAAWFPEPFAKIDLHAHAWPGTAEELARLERAHGIELAVNLSGGPAGEPLAASLAAAGAAAPGAPGARPRLLVFANADLRGCCDAAWAAREADAVRRAKEQGARGVAIPVDLGGGATARDVGDPALEPLWDACERAGVPVVLHVAEHATGAAPADALAAISAVARRHPKLPVVGSHLAGAAGRPADLAAALAALPNLHVDLAGAVAPGVDADALRALLLAHPDRVLFGTEVRVFEADGVEVAAFGAGPPGGRPEMLRFFDATWRFLESRDEDLPPAAAAAGDGPLRGLGLPRAVLERVYHANAERLLGVAPPESAERRR